MHRQVEARAAVGIIGGSGVYDQDAFENVRSLTIATPYGAPSAPLELGTFRGVPTAFLPRHGKGHTIPPHRINFRANLWALHCLGVQWVLSPCAVGSLQEELTPGMFVIPDQFIDLTKNRPTTFFDGGKVYHIPMDQPFCPTLGRIIAAQAAALDLPHHAGGTYLCIEGPRFSTKAESKMFRTFADIIGMTACPEVALARELEMSYASIAMVTDYDVWADKPVSTEEVLKTLGANLTNSAALLRKVIPAIPFTKDSPYKGSLQHAAL